MGAHRNSRIAIVIQQSFLILFSSWRWISVFHAPIYWPSKKHYVAWVTWIIASDFEMSCRQTLSSSLVDQVILKCKSTNVTSTPHHFNGLELSPIPSFWPSPLFFLPTGLYTCCLFHMERHHPIVPICWLTYICLCASTSILLSLGSYLNLSKLVLPSITQTTL